MKNFSIEQISDIPYMGTYVDLISVNIDLQKNTIVSFEAEKGNSHVTIPNDEDKYFMLKLITAQVKLKYPEYFL